MTLITDLTELEALAHFCRDLSSNDYTITAEAPTSTRPSVLTKLQPRFADVNAETEVLTRKACADVWERARNEAKCTSIANSPGMDRNDSESANLNLDLDLNVNTSCRK